MEFVGNLCSSADQHSVQENDVNNLTGRKNTVGAIFPPLVVGTKLAAGNARSKRAGHRVVPSQRDVQPICSETGS